MLRAQVGLAVRRLPVLLGSQPMRSVANRYQTPISLHFSFKKRSEDQQSWWKNQGAGRTRDWVWSFLRHCPDMPCFPDTQFPHSESSLLREIDQSLLQNDQQRAAYNRHPNSSLHFFLIILFFYFTILYWFCHTLTWIHHRCTWVPNPEPPSHHPPHIISLSHPSAPAPSILYPVWNLD